MAKVPEGRNCATQLETAHLKPSTPSIHLHFIFRCFLYGSNKFSAEKGRHGHQLHPHPQVSPQTPAHPASTLGHRLLRFSESAPELLEDVLGQELEDHPADEMRLLLLIAPVPHVGQIQPDLLDVREADVARTQEGGELVVVGRAQVERHIAVEGFYGDFVEMFAHEAEAFEV